MKKKDLITMAAALIILAVAGYIAVTQLGLFGSTKSKVVMVEVAPVIEPDYSQSALNALSDASKVRDFTAPVDLSGLGNPSPFQPF